MLFGEGLIAFEDIGLSLPGGQSADVLEDLAAGPSMNHFSFLCGIINRLLKLKIPFCLFMTVHVVAQ